MKRSGAKIPSADWIPADGCRLKLRRLALERWEERAPASLCHWRVLVHDARMSRPVPGLPGFRTLYGVVLVMDGDCVATVLPRNLLRQPDHGSVRSLPQPRGRMPGPTRARPGH